MVAMAPKIRGVTFTDDHFSTNVKMKAGDIAGEAVVGPNSKTIEYPSTWSGGRLSDKGKPHKVNAKMVAQFLEFGTSLQAKKPFLTQAWENVKSAVQSKIIDVIRKN